MAGRFSRAVGIGKPSSGTQPAAIYCALSKATPITFYRWPSPPDGQRIVTGSRDQTAKVWDAASAKLLRTLEGHHGPVWSVAFSPDGERIVTGSWDRTARVWAVAEARELVRFEKHSDA